MALNETPLTGLSGGTTIVPGTVMLVNGKPAVVPSAKTTVSAWASALGGSPVITAADSVGRTKGAFLPSDSPFNINVAGQRGLDIFET